MHHWYLDKSRIYSLILSFILILQPFMMAFQPNHAVLESRDVSSVKPKEPKARYGLAEGISEGQQAFFDPYSLINTQAPNPFGRYENYPNGLTSTDEYWMQSAQPVSEEYSFKKWLGDTWAGLQTWWKPLEKTTEDNQGYETKQTAPKRFFLADVQPEERYAQASTTQDGRITANQSALINLLYFPVITKPGVFISDESGGVVTLPSESFAIAFEANGLPEPISVSAKPVTQVELPVNFAPRGPVVNVDAIWVESNQPVTQLDPDAQPLLLPGEAKPIPQQSEYFANLTFELDVQHILNFSPKRFSVARLDEASGKWEIIPSQLDGLQNTITAKTDELGQFAVIENLAWSEASPYEDAIIIDDGDAGFACYEHDGSLDYLWSIDCGNGGCWAQDAKYTWNRSGHEPLPLGEPWNWCEWTPVLPEAGEYSVLVYIPANGATTHGAIYQIFHNDTVDSVTIDQTGYSGAWVDLGVFDFTGYGSEYVYLDDVVPETQELGSQIGIDAVMFVEGDVTAPPSVEIIQLYGTGKGQNGNLSVSLLPRITAGGAPITSMDVTISQGTVTQPLSPYASNYHGPDVYAALFEDVPENTTIDFEVTVADGSNTVAAQIQGYFTDGRFVGTSACINYNINGHTLTCGNPVSTIGSHKIEHLPTFLYLPGIGDADLHIAPVYNSHSIRLGLFGAAMSSELDMAVVPLYNPLVEGVEIALNDGGRFRLVDNGDGSFTPDGQGFAGELEKQGDDYLYTTPDHRNSYLFNAEGRLMEKRDRNGNTVVFNWSGDQLTSAVVRGQTVTFSYSGDYITAITIGGKTITFTYDGDKLVAVTDANGGTWQLEYETREIGEIIDERGEEFAYIANNHYLTKVTSPEGRVKNEQIYDGEGRVIWQGSLSGEFTFEWIENADGSRETHIVDAYDKHEVHYYNSLGQVVQRTNRLGKSEYFSYNDNFHLERKIDLNGEEWEYTRDERGNILEVFGPEGLHEVWEYNEFNFPTYFKDGDGFEWRWEYDGQGNNTEVSQPTPDGASMTTAYNAQGLPTDIFDYNNNHIHLTYDPTTGDVWSINDGEDGLTQFWYDQYGRLAHMMLPEGNEWEYHYDLNDNLTDVFGPDNYHEAFTYDKDDLLKTEQDADGYTTTYDYDDRARLIETRNDEDEPTFYRYGEMNELQEEENAREAVTSYTYDDDLRLIQVDLPESVTLTYDYDDLGNILFFTDGEGRTTATTYDGLSRPFAVIENYIEGGPITSDTNVVTQFTHDYRNNVTLITNPLNDEQEFGYDSVGRLQWSENEEDERTEFEYDKNSNQTLIRYPEGNTLEAEYNGRNQPKLIRDGEGFETTLTYDDNGNLQEQIDPDGVTLFFEHNALDQQIRRTANFLPLQLPGPDTNVTTEFSYSLAGDLEKVVDAKNYEFLFEYDKAHRLVKETNPEGEVTYILDAVGNVETRVDANGKPWQYEYDFLNRLTDAINPQTHRWSYGYDKASNVVATTDARQHTTVIEYDALNRPVLITDPLEYETQLTYNPIGSLLTLEDGNEHTAYFEYDKAQRLTKQIDAEGYRAEYAYDQNGRPVLQRIPFADSSQTIEESFVYDGRDLITSSTNGEGEVTRYFYTSLGQVNTKVENDSITTFYGYDNLRRLNQVVLNYDTSALAVSDLNVAYTYNYDRVSNLVSVIDPKRNETIFEYNGLGSLEYERNPLESEWVYDYDPEQNLTYRQDADGQITRYEYYADNQLSLINYPNDPDVTFNYDPNNNQTHMQDGLGTTSWAYDDLNRVTQVTDSLGRVVEYTYDAVNRRSITYPDNRTVAYTYLDNDWMETVTDPKGGTSLYSYDEAGRVIYTDHPNATYTTQTYDRAHRLLSLGNYQRTQNGNDDVLSAFEYEYDSVGQRVQIANTYGWRQPDVIIENFTYDGLRRLIGVTDSEGMYATYEYDRASNRTKWETNDDPFGQSPQDDFVATYDYNEGNQLLTTAIGRTPTSQSETIYYSYDNNGNRIDKLTEGNGADRGMSYTYDDENRLISAYSYLVTGNRINWQDETRAEYDGLSRRLVETYDPHAANSGGLKRTEYTFDGLDPIAEYDLWNKHQRNYYRGRNNELIQLHNFPSGTQGQQYWYHHNGLGSIAGLTKHNGNSTHNYPYDAFGGVIPANGNFTQPHNEYTLTEKAVDKHTGLYYFGARYYDPLSANWITQDTYRGELDKPLSLHRYMYVNENPVNYADWYGYCSKQENIDAGCPSWTPDWAFDTYEWTKEEVVEPVQEAVETAIPYIVDSAKYAASYTAGLVVEVGRSYTNQTGESSLDEISSPGFQQGRLSGNMLATGLALLEISGGGGMAGFGASTLPVTTGACAYATVGSGGVSGPPCGAIIAGEIGLTVVGTAVATHGVLVLSCTSQNRDRLVDNTRKSNGGSNRNLNWRPLKVDDLPSSYKTPKSGARKVVVQHGPYKGRKGWIDKNGDIWVPAKAGESHGGPHWDVQINGGKSGHRNVYP